MSLAEGSEMALVTLSAVAEEKQDEKYQMQTSLPAWSSHILTSASIFVIHSLMALSTASHLLMLAAYALSAWKKREGFEGNLDLYRSPLRELSSSERRRCHCPGLSWLLQTLPSSASPEVFCMIVWIWWDVMPYLFKRFLSLLKASSILHTSLHPLLWPDIQLSWFYGSILTWRSRGQTSWCCLSHRPGIWHPLQTWPPLFQLISLNFQPLRLFTCFRFCIQSREGILHCIHPSDLYND